MQLAVDVQIPEIFTGCGGRAVYIGKVICRHKKWYLENKYECIAVKKRLMISHTPATRPYCYSPPYCTDTEGGFSAARLATMAEALSSHLKKVAAVSHPVTRRPDPDRDPHQDPAPSMPINHPYTTLASSLNLAVQMMLSCFREIKWPIEQHKRLDNVLHRPCRMSRIQCPGIPCSRYTSCNGRPAPTTCPVPILCKGKDPLIPCRGCEFVFKPSHLYSRLDLPLPIAAPIGVWRWQEL